MTHRSPLARHRTLAAEARREAAKAKKLGQTETAREWLAISYSHRHEIAVKSGPRAAIKAMGEGR